MKNVVRMLLLSAVVLAGLAVSAAAQSAGPQKAQVDFDFYVGNKLMPAGEYAIKPVSQDISHGVVMIEQVNGNAKAAVQTFPARTAENLKPGSLLFKKYGDNHYLSAFQLGNENYMHQIMKNTESRIVKREAARKVAQIGEAKASAPSNE